MSDLLADLPADPIWILAALIFGTLVCLVPSKVRYEFAKTKVMGVAPGVSQPKAVTGD